MNRIRKEDLGLDYFLTNDPLSGKYPSQFDLVNHAIKLAENMIISGRAPRVKMMTQNPARIVLEEIKQGKDEFIEIQKYVEPDHTNSTFKTSDVQSVPKE